MNISLHDVSRAVSKASGYISVDRGTGAIRTKGGNFLSRLVVWIRFKTSASYRASILESKREVMASMLADDVYGDDFRQKIEGLDKKNSIFFNNKPLSARKVRRFISDVTQEVDQSRQQKRANETLRIGLVNWVSGKGGTIASGETFDDNLAAMLGTKIKDERGITAKDVDLQGISDEINQTALDDRSGMVAVTDGTQAQVHVNKVMSRILDRRIADARSQMRARLQKRLSVSGLPEAEKLKIGVEISSSKIATMDELDQHVNQLVIKEIEGEFASLLQQARERYGFRDELSQLSEVRKQLKEKLMQQDEHRMLATDAARDKATQLLNQWIESKQEALLACQESQYAGLSDLLTKLTLRIPSIDKTHVRSFRQTIEQTLDEVYEKDRTSYEALNVDKAKLFSMLRTFDRRSVLFNSVYKLARKTHEQSSLFADEVKQAPNIKAIAQDYVEALSKSMVASYEQVSALKGKVPPHIHQTMMEKVSKGYVWEPRFISAANGMHIDSLVQKKNEGLYELLDSPQVARKRIGNKEDFVSFTLDDLLKAMLGSKNINNHAKRRQAIDQVVPKEAKQKLLDELDQQLLMVRSRVMNEEDADALFQRGTVRFLRAQKIDFEEMTSKD